MTDALKKLREPFPAHQISYLPKGGVKLAYVGHAALTDRLLDTDPAWTWEPLALDERGLPALDEVGGLWIRLTVAGVTRLGYGDAGSKKGGDAMKERIGDALHEIGFTDRGHGRLAAPRGRAVGEDSRIATARRNRAP